MVTNSTDDFRGHQSWEDWDLGEICIFVKDSYVKLHVFYIGILNKITNFPQIPIFPTLMTSKIMIKNSNHFKFSARQSYMSILLGNNTRNTLLAIMPDRAHFELKVCGFSGLFGELFTYQKLLKFLRLVYPSFWRYLTIFAEILVDFGALKLKILRNLIQTHRTSRSTQSHRDRVCNLARGFPEGTRGEIQQWESRDPELSGTSKIFKIGPIAKKLQHFKVGQISDTFLNFQNFRIFEKSKISIFRFSKIMIFRKSNILDFTVFFSIFGKS